MRVFGPDGLLADELGRQVFVFGGDFLADFASGLLAAATNLVLGFQHHALHFQLNARQRMSAPTRLLFECFLVLGRQLWFQNLLADRRWPLRLLLQVTNYLPQLLLLLRVKLVGLWPEELPFELSDIRTRLSQQLLLPPQLLFLLRQLVALLANFLL
jgi:hypothetical protein